MNKYRGATIEKILYLGALALLSVPVLAFGQYNWTTLESEPTQWMNNSSHIYANREGSVVLGALVPSGGNILHVAGDMGAVGYCGPLGVECFAPVDTVWRISGNDIYNINSANVGVGITTPTQKLSVDGMMLADNYLYTSDARFKTNITDLEGLDLVSQLRGVRFDWREDGRSDIGLIAQEVEEVLPEVVVTDEEGYKRVDYATLVATLVATLNEQQEELSDLQQKLSSLRY